jgi:hypothetical protein
VSERISAARVLGKPPFAHALFLLEHLFDSPERGESKHAQQGREEDVVHPYRGNHTGYAQQEEHPPAFGAPIIFGFYHNGVKETDDEKRANADKQTGKMVFIQEVHNDERR